MTNPSKIASVETTDLEPAHLAGYQASPAPTPTWLEQPWKETKDQAKTTGTKDTDDTTVKTTASKTKTDPKSSPLTTTKP